MNGNLDLAIATEDVEKVTIRSVSQQLDGVEQTKNHINNEGVKGQVWKKQHTHLELKYITLKPLHNEYK